MFNMDKIKQQSENIIFVDLPAVCFAQDIYNFDFNFNTYQKTTHFIIYYFTLSRSFQSKTLANLQIYILNNINVDKRFFIHRQQQDLFSWFSLFSVSSSFKSFQLSDFKTTHSTSQRLLFNSTVTYPSLNNFGRACLFTNRRIHNMEFYTIFYMSQKW